VDWRTDAPGVREKFSMKAKKGRVRASNDRPDTIENPAP
jgi:hypothetical protein